MSIFQSISNRKTLLITSIGACKVLVPTCISKIGFEAKHPNLICLGASATLLCISIYIRRKYWRSLSKWKLAFSFGARLAGVRFVERYIDDPDDATNALRILQTMVKTDSHIHKFVIELGGIETTIKAMKRYFKDNEGVAASGAGLISLICGYNTKTDQKLMNCGHKSVSWFKLWNFGRTTKKCKRMHQKL